MMALLDLIRALGLLQITSIQDNQAQAFVPTHKLPKTVLNTNDIISGITDEQKSAGTYWAWELGSEQRKSISDYMGGHHAGKFDFDPRISGVTALNYEKSIIFEKPVKAGPILAPAGDDGDQPSWASRTLDVNQATALSNNICLEQGIEAVVTVKNEERSWESFYASVESFDGKLEDCFEVSPSSGRFAPRGGVHHYADEWEIRVRRNNFLPSNTDADANVEAGDALFLVVRTECENLAWRIVI
mmetsp:Transcript_5072/g.10698  ORF Transcript_5072/g.10698 Transcript_5072/m.10698 type:complete len:244 (-) Transcript_5072:311-1042(-)